MKGPHVYVVDDDPVYRLVAHRLLTQLNPGPGSLDFFEDAAPCLVKFKQEVMTGIARKPDIILLDIEMPVMNGWMFLEEFARLPFEYRKDIRIYIVSSSIADADLQQATKYPEIVEYIPKPLTKEILDKILANENLF